MDTLYSKAGVHFPKSQKGIRYLTIILRNGEYTLYKLDQKNNPVVIKNDVLETPNGIEDFVWSDQHEMLITVGGQCQGRDFF